ncbi:MAG TPA: glycosyltransferase [Bacteroidales bacterium]|nr:glycosyltransferase [Bacteroidales bacterium]HCI55876.1 4-alpha-glucanotransferase [Bacteroidales bacterium]HOU96577.1 glycosyltransferase [Bacteroidales bacterium]HQG37153.1 glycosyltransferase [Bacteroidales bacterium]HQG53624.1 glycosyltransferase [Bacteroidales bacterium]
MRVLMFGWEFPPHISGGLGTASYGLTKAMTAMKDMEIIFVVPKAWGDEDQSAVKVIGANNVPVTFRKVYYEGFKRAINTVEIKSEILPYVSTEEFFELTKKKENAEKRLYVQTNVEGKIDFSGSYKGNLLDEIYKYSVVAAVIASELDFDIIHAHDWLTYPAGIAAMEVSGKPLVIHVHATEFDRSGGNVNPDVYAIEKRGMEAATKIITVSNYTRETVINKYFINPEKIETVYNAVEPVYETEHVQVTKGFDEKVVTFLGRITLQKGPDYFIEVANKVLKVMKNVRFVMAGSGDMLERMMRRVASLKIADRFHFTGFLYGKDVFTMLAMSDVYIMPSVSEPFGISPLEAMLANVPVIISKQSGVAEIITHAVKVDFWDIDAMADAIYGILSYSALAREFTKNGREEVIRIKWENSARHVREIYEEVLSKYKII